MTLARVTAVLAIVAFLILVPLPSCAGAGRLDAPAPPTSAVARPAPGAA